MKTLNCEYVRDVYPDVLNGTAASELAQAVRAHVASCDECRGEVAVLEMIHAAPVTVPAGLHARVTKAVLQPKQRWRFSRNELAMVATLAVALIGGSVLLQTTSQPRPEEAKQGFGFVSVEDAMMSGKASLDDLSVEELETLLQEIES